MRVPCRSVRMTRWPWLAVWLWASFAGWADDWPQWMGPERDGVWREKGIMNQFPEGGLEILWRVPIGKTYCGPAVANGKVYLLDRKELPRPASQPGTRPAPGIPGRERIFCLSANTGELFWEHNYDCTYNIGYPSGPRATPVVRDDRVYALGAMGDLHCLETEQGKVLWHREFLKDYSKEPPTWGWAAHPLLDGDRLICLVGGTNSAVVAFHKDTGKEIWRAVTARDLGYAPPVIYQTGARRQLITWHPDSVNGLDPMTGEVLWSFPYPVVGKPARPGVTIAMPRMVNHRLFLTSFYSGSMLLEIGVESSASVKLVWDRHSSKTSELNDGLHTTMGTPVFRENHIYGVCGRGELRCLEAGTGNRLWETNAVAGEGSGWFAQAFLVEHEENVFIWTDHGELILAQLDPRGYQEKGRVKLSDPKENTRGRDVLWCHPAFANGCVYVHNGEELICVSLRDRRENRRHVP